MENFISINGDLDEKSMSGLKREIMKVDKHNTLHFTIESDGGNTESVHKFILWFDKIKENFIQTNIKIYKAVSAAAVLAYKLAPSENRSITDNGLFILHKPVVTIPSACIEGRIIPQSYSESIVNWNKIVNSLFEEIPNEKRKIILIDYDLTHKVRINPKLCLELGIVSKII